MTTKVETAQFAGMAGIAIATFAAFALASDVGSGLVAGALVLAVAVAVQAGRRRSPTLEAMGGLGDERVRHINMRASAFVGSLMSIVLPAAWLVSVARGEPDTTLSALCALAGAAWIGSIVVLQRRG